MAGALYDDLPMKVLAQSNKILRGYEKGVTFTPSLGAIKVRQQLYQQTIWPIGQIGNGIIGEGTDATNFTSEQPILINIQSNILRSRGWNVSRDAMASEQADVANEVVKQRGRDEELFVQDIECNFLSAQEMDDSSVSGFRVNRGLINWMTPVTGTSPYGTNHVFAQHPAFAPVDVRIAPAAEQFYDGGLANLVELPTAGSYSLQDILGFAYQKTLSPMDLVGWCGVNVKQKMSRFAQKMTITSGEAATALGYYDAEDKRLTRMVDFFQYDTAMIRTKLSSYVGATSTPAGVGPTNWNINNGYTANSAVFVEPTYMKVGWYRPIKHSDVDKMDVKGAGMRGYHECNVMLIPEHLNGFVIYGNS